MPSDPSAVYQELLARQLPRAVTALRALPPALGLALVAAGAVLLLAGARRRRPIAAIGGTVAGALAGVALSGAAAQARISAASAVGAGALGVALLSLLFPPLFPLVLGAAIGGLVGVQLPLGHPAIAAVVGALAVGGVAVLGARPLAAGVAGLGGAGLVVAGALALAPALPGSAAVARHPVLAVGLVLVLGIAGAAAQVEAAWGGAPRGAGGRRAIAQPRARGEPGDA